MLSLPLPGCSRSWAALPLLSLLSLLSMAAPHAARAGSYGAPTYSGGTTTVTIPGAFGSPFVYYYALYNSGYGGSYYGISNPGSTVNCQGPITTTFTWHADYANEPLPKSVIVQETCSAGFGGSSGTANDGLGDAPVSNPYSGQSKGTRYKVVAGQATITLTCSPSATVAANGQSCGAGLTYSAAVSPVTINLTGGIGASNAKHLLIGQQLTAALNSMPLNQASWNWTVSGGNPFKNWVASDANAVYTPIGSETSSPLVCYFAKPDTATVNCSAHLTVPSGASPAAGLDVTATQTLTVEKPSAQLSIVIGHVADLPSSTNPADVQLQQVYRYPPDGNANGITWNGTITTPAAYVTSGDYGSWNWTQLITASRQEKNNGVYWQFAVDTTTPPTVINGIKILDGMYPYGYFQYPANGTATGNADSPWQLLDSNITIREYDVSDSFKDYLMYQAPGSGSVPVPLQENDWFWQFQALKNASNAWSTSGKNAQWGYVGDFPAFPTWTFCASIGHLTYVSP